MKTEGKLTRIGVHQGGSERRSSYGEGPACFQSTKLGTTLDTGDLPTVQNLMQKVFDLVACSKLAWLHELRELGYSFEEIAK